MANSRTFTLLNGVTIEKIGEHLVAWFQNTKNMIAEGGKAQGGGYFVQAKDQEDGWKKISGLTKAIQVQLMKADNNVIVNCDFGKWSDKVGAGAVGMFLFAPLAATAAFGAVKQSQLPNEVFAEIEKFIISGGHSAVVTMGGRLNDDEVECPVCKAKNPKGQKFCKECGSKLGKTCPNCGASIDNDTKFCPECGSSTVVSIVCVNCGAPLTEGQKFCPSCGAKQEKTCPQCGAVISGDTKFCPACGAPTSGKKLCPNCKAEVDPNAAFCPECGTKING
jgi:hypothetical protein